MFQIGEIRKAKELGKVGSYKYIYQTCPSCNKSRWVALKRGKPTGLRCKKCTLTEPKRQFPKPKGTITSPILGDIYKDKLLGYKDNRYHIWSTCIKCERELWAKLDGYKPRNTICKFCKSKASGLKRRGALAYNWKGGRRNWNGYVQVYVERDSFFYPMAEKCGYVMEHRLIMAQHLGRCLQPWEKVHHKDGIKDHNEYSNFELSTSGSHILEHSKGYRDGYYQGYQDSQNSKVEELKKEIRLLRWQVQELVKEHEVPARLQKAYNYIRIDDLQRDTQ